MIAEDLEQEVEDEAALIRHDDGECDPYSCYFHLSEHENGDCDPTECVLCEGIE